MAAAELTISGDGDCLTVHARGRWTGEGAAALDGRLQSIDAKGYRRVRVDLATVEALDTVGAWLIARTGAELQSKGVQIHSWSPEILKAFEEKWQEVVAEQKAKSPEFAKIWASYSDYRAKYKIWRENGYLK